MTEPIEIWAPLARDVALLLGGERRPARRGTDGWWIADPLPAGADYHVSIDGGPGRPDPRSRLQPQGVHGPSRVVDRTFAWRDEDFRATPLADALVYELHVGTFTQEGTFAAAAARLDHLAAMHVTHVELMPVATFPGRWGWGYDGVDLFAPHPAYGTPGDLKRFVAACHARGIAVLMDVVYNHLGPDGNYLGEFGPYFTDRHRTPWGSAVNLDGPGSDFVRRFFLDNARMWLEEFHCDGLRLDAVHALYDQSAIPFLEQFAREVAALSERLGRRFELIAESDLNDPRLIQDPGAGGYGLSAQWSDDFHHALHALLTGERNGYYVDFGSLADLARTLTDGYAFAGRFSRFRQRTHGRPLGVLSGARLLGYLQTHDQVGNRAHGERIGHLVSPGRLRIGAALVFLAPFVPMIFQGEEWAASSPFQYFTDHEDEGLAEAVRSGRREEFRAFGDVPDVPDPQAESTFRRSVLDFGELEREPHRSVLHWYRRLAALRAATPALRDGRRDRVHVRFDEARRWLRLERGPATFLANLGDAPLTLDLPAAAAIQLAYPAPSAPGRGRVELPPDGCVLALRGGNDL